MDNRHPTLPIDLKYDLFKELTEFGDGDDSYDFEKFREILASSFKLRETTHDVAKENIKKAQLKQTTIKVIANQNRPCLLVQRYFFKTESDRTEKVGNFIINGLIRIR